MIPMLYILDGLGVDQRVYTLLIGINRIEHVWKSEIGIKERGRGANREV